MSTTKKIQRFETSRTELPIHCPFCGAQAYAPDQDSDPVAEGCKHLLFVAHDEGFELRSDRFDALMKIAGKDDQDIELGEKGYDGFTDRVQLADSIKFAIYTPAPSFFGLYIGFAPTDDE
jgi:hypothetical protein